MKKIDAVILCGGQGKRLKQLVSDKPKPMADINGLPFLDRLIGYIDKIGINNYILCAGFMAEYIEKYYQATNKIKNLIIVKEKQPLGTAGALKNAQKFIKTDPFLVVNGDSFCAVDLKKFFGFHLARKASLSMVVCRKENEGDQGSVILDSSDKIAGLEEKTRSASSLVNAGVYLFNKKMLSLIPRDVKYSLELDLFPKLVGKKFYGFQTDARLLDIGTPRRYKQAKEFFLNLRY